MTEPLDTPTALKACIDLANSERQAIWARNAAMLVGNSFMLNAIRLDIGNAAKWLDVVFCVVGIFICALWAVMTWFGWTYHHAYIRRALDLPIDPQLNPLRQGDGRPPRLERDVIFACTLALIVLFAIVYAVTLGYTLSVE